MKNGQIALIVLATLAVVGGIIALIVYFATKPAATPEPPGIIISLPDELGPEWRKVSANQFVPKQIPVDTLSQMLSQSPAAFLQQQGMQRQGMQRQINQIVLGGNPIILVPGIGGSILHAKGTKLNTPSWNCGSTFDENVWLSPQLFLPKGLGFSCWVDTVKIHWDPVNKVATSTPNLVIEPPAYGSTYAVDTLYTIMGKEVYMTDYLSKFIDYLTAQGYVDGLSLFGSPYDWRCIVSPDKMDAYVNRFQNLIVHAYELNNQTKVTLYCHSMGAKLTHYILVARLSQEFKDKYINKLIISGAAIGGSPKSVRTVVSGDNLDIPTISNDDFLPMERTFPTLPWMKPNATVYSQLPTVDAGKKQFNFSDPSFLELMASIGQPAIAEAFVALSQNKIVDTVHPGVAVTVIRPVCTATAANVTEGKGTESMYKYTEGFVDPTAIRGETVLYDLLRAQGDTFLIGKSNDDTLGDSTVPYLSLTIPMRYWTKNTSAPPVTEVVLRGDEMSHQGHLLTPSFFAAFTAAAGQPPPPPCYSTPKCTLRRNGLQCQVKCKPYVWGSSYWKNAVPNPLNPNADLCDWYSRCTQ